jgi:hypothetical protein
LRPRLAAGLPFSQRTDAPAWPAMLPRPDEFPMNFAAFDTNLKNDLTRFHVEESVFNNEILRTPCMRTSENSYSTTFVNKGMKKGR